MSFIKTFDQVTKHTFDQTPVLLETFDQVIRSSEIRSSDPLSKNILFEIVKVVIAKYNGSFRKEL
jgi:hypothetical protein